MIKLHNSTTFSLNRIPSSKIGLVYLRTHNSGEHPVKAIPHSYFIEAALFYIAKHTLNFINTQDPKIWSQL